MAVVKGKALVCLFLFGTLVGEAGFARDVPVERVEALGFSTERLERLDAMAARAVETGMVAGAVILVQRRGETAFHRAWGVADVESGEALEPDDLFRIASMSKAITSVGVMMLFEEGRFLLDDPVGMYLPAFDRPFEVVMPEGSGFTTRPADGPITIRHLLSHTSGMAYRFMAPPGLVPHYSEADIDDGLGAAAFSLEETVQRVAGLPLAHDPGAGWTYGLNTDVLGRLIEVVSGQSLDRFLEARLFEPLGMEDTFFEVPADQRHRLAAVHRRGDDGVLIKVPDGPIEDGPVMFSASYPYDGRTDFPSGGAGLVSTARDYARFLQMLLDGGALDGRRILGRKTVELLLADQTEGLPSRGFGTAGFTLAFGQAWGPGAGQIQSKGTLGWGGFFSTDAWFDPREQLVGVLMTQHYPFGHRLMESYKVGIYQALVE